jgi:transcriptional regulator with XRE-family HTH domain
MAGVKKTATGMEVRLIFARNLRRLRERQNISQLELSSLTGLTHNFINDIENCKKWISPETLAKFATALQVQPFQFFLSEVLIGEYEEDRLSIYREDFADSFQKMAADWMNTYLPKSSGITKKS